MEDFRVGVEGKEITITNPHKAMWVEPRITKLDYVNYLVSVSDFLLPYTKNRLLMVWRYPDGVGSKRIVQKSVPEFAPDWIPRAFYKDKEWILLNDRATLVWLANLAALEFHVPFDTYDHTNYPTELVFDLDPMDVNNFELVLEVALILKEVLDSLGLFSLAKSSGSTGLQIYVPVEPKYRFEDARKINKFAADHVRLGRPYTPSSRNNLSIPLQF